MSSSTANFEGEGKVTELKDGDKIKGDITLNGDHANHLGQPDGGVTSTIILSKNGKIFSNINIEKGKKICKYSLNYFVWR